MPKSLTDIKLLHLKVFIGRGKKSSMRAWGSSRQAGQSLLLYFGNSAAGEHAGEVLF